MRTPQLNLNFTQPSSNIPEPSTGVRRPVSANEPSQFEPMLEVQDVFPKTTSNLIPQPESQGSYWVINTQQAPSNNDRIIASIDHHLVMGLIKQSTSNSTRYFIDERNSQQHTKFKIIGILTHTLSKI